MNIFYAATTITFGNGRKTTFWHAPWLDGRAPKDIAPKIFEASKCNKWTVAKALQEDSWIVKIKLENSATWEHIVQFVELWTLINNVHLEIEVEDSIVWKLRRMANTPRHRLTSFNSLASSIPICITLRGRLGPPRRLKIMLGLPFKIGFGRSIGFKHGVGLIVGFALFASNARKQPTIFLSLAASP
jgi:hypothetical protein